MSNLNFRAEKDEILRSLTLNNIALLFQALFNYSAKRFLFLKTWKII